MKHCLMHMVVGLVKKGLEWLVVLICVVVSHVLSVESVSGTTMTYMMATELVSLIENLTCSALMCHCCKSCWMWRMERRKRKGNKEDGHAPESFDFPGRLCFIIRIMYDIMNKSRLLWNGVLNKTY